MARSIRTTPAPAEMTGDQFKENANLVVEQIAKYLDSIRNRPLTPGKSVREIKQLLPTDLPEKGAPPSEWLEKWTETILENSLYNGHPRFWGFITSSATPVGAIGDMLGAAINPNLGGWLLSPIATEIELQVVRWIAEFIGYKNCGGGILVSGGNMANMVGFWAARKKKATWDIRKEGAAAGKRMIAYVSEETHTWIQKATDLSGMGTNSIRWIETDETRKMSIPKLKEAIEEDLVVGNLPFLVAGTAGSVSLGVVDPLKEIKQVCDQYDLWFHVDGAYGAPAAAAKSVPQDLKELDLADSIAIDPHKWLYAPLEAGAILVRNADDLRDAFSYHPPYYPDEETGEMSPTMLHEYGPQNSRGFRALKVWMGFMQVGSEGMAQMIEEDILLAKYLDSLIESDPQLESTGSELSINTFRYLPDISGVPEEKRTDFINQVNKTLLDELQVEGELFITHAILGEMFVLRSCIVNFRTQMSDIEAIPGCIISKGEIVSKRLKQNF